MTPHSFNAQSKNVLFIYILCSHENVRETGKKGLMLPKSSEEGFTSSPPPRFPDMVKYFHRRADILLKSGDCYSTAAGKLPFSPAILIEALGFLRLCLEESAGVSEEDRFTGKTLDNVREYLLKIQPTDLSPVELYLELLLQSLGPAGGGAYTHIIYGNTLLLFTKIFDTMHSSVHDYAVFGSVVENIILSFRYITLSSNDYIE